MIGVDQALALISKVHMLFCSMAIISHRWQRGWQCWLWWSGRWGGWRWGWRPASGEAWAALAGLWGSGLSGEATEDLIDFSIPCPEDTHPNVGSCTGQGLIVFSRILILEFRTTGRVWKGWIWDRRRDGLRRDSCSPDVPMAASHTWQLKSAGRVGLPLLLPNSKQKQLIFKNKP